MTPGGDAEGVSLTRLAACQCDLSMTPAALQYDLYTTLAALQYDPLHLQYMTPEASLYDAPYTTQASLSIGLPGSRRGLLRLPLCRFFTPSPPP